MSNEVQIWAYCCNSLCFLVLSWNMQYLTSYIVCGSSDNNHRGYLQTYSQLEKKKKKVNFSVKHDQHFISLSREEQLTITQFWWQMVMNWLLLEQSHTDRFVCLRNTLMKKINTMPLMVPSPYIIGE